MNVTKILKKIKKSLTLEAHKLCCALIGEFGIKFAFRKFFLREIQ